MNSFDITLTSEWQEILNGSGLIAFDIAGSKAVELYFTETEGAPAASARGTFVQSSPISWDYEGVGFEVNQQYIYARGSGAIRGVR